MTQLQREDDPFSDFRASRESAGLSGLAAVLNVCFGEINLRNDLEIFGT